MLNVGLGLFVIVLDNWHNCQSGIVLDEYLRNVWEKILLWNKADIYLSLHSPSPVKHVPNVPRTDITKSTEDKEEKTEKPKQVP